MKRSLLLSLASTSVVLGADADLGTITIKEEINTKIVKNIDGQEVKSADLAETLHKKAPSISMIRRSGIANDIILRGQKRDNIAVTIDDSFIHGACPNRMDPPTSHVLSSNVDNVKISEGPFDVENFGVLSGSVKVETKKPTKELSGDVYLNAGSYGYKKTGASISGGNDKIQILLAASKESSEQYKDGNGNTLAQQLENATKNTSNASRQYSDNHKDMDAFEKKTFMFKTAINIADNQDLELSHTKNESDNVLYANTPMDAIYDDSEITNLRYEARELSSLSKKLQIKAYKSEVEHPMSTKYRKSAAMMEMVNSLTTEKKGLKIINDTEVSDALLTLGVDTSDRNWDGHYLKNGSLAGNSIDDVDTKNNAIFTKYNKDISNINIEFGARYNDTTISTANTSYKDKDYNSVDANVFLTYSAKGGARYFAGLGKSSRVPDARELYFVKSMKMIGTPNLEQTTNKEIDFGVEKSYDNAYAKIKFFYSILEDYIYFNGDKSTNAFTNIDAKIYGFEFSGNYDINDKFYLDSGLAYKVGKKDKALEGQRDKDLADITPLKASLALNYEHDATFKAMAEIVGAKSWNKYDADNGEQKIAGYSVVNLKANKTFAKNFEFILGIDNLFDKTYAVSNTYNDLILLSDGSSNEVMLLNEPGRYYYTSLKYKF